jgi:AraC-like DNA-binding protein
MSESDSYGEAFGRRLNAAAASFATHALPRTTIAVTELKYVTPQNILSTPPIEEDAYLVAVHFKNFPNYTYWENGKAAPVSPIRPGETIVYSVERRPTFRLNCAFHSVHFYFPRAALDALSDDANAPRIHGLRYKPAVAHADAVLRGMAEALLPAFRTRDRVNRLFMDHVMIAVGSHVAARYGGMRSKERPAPGRLTASQERRAKEMLREHLAGEVPLRAVADACGLSLSQFSRAFRKSVGVPPYRWAMQQRIALAKALLREDTLALSQMALKCGFSDQSHFTRSFSSMVGVSPGAWRRAVRE